VLSLSFILSQRSIEVHVAAIHEHMLAGHVRGAGREQEYYHLPRSRPEMSFFSPEGSWTGPTDASVPDQGMCRATAGRAASMTSAGNNRVNANAVAQQLRRPFASQSQYCLLSMTHIPMYHLDRWTAVFLKLMFTMQPARFLQIRKSEVRHVVVMQQIST